MIDNDDRPIGRVLSRREVLALMGGMGAAFFVSACVPATPGAVQATSTSASTATPLTPTVSGATATTASMAAPALVDVTPSVCVVRPELTEGPLFVEEDLDRSDIRLDPTNGKMSEGVPLELTFRISSIHNRVCAPLSGVQVDVWHCDADGIYSDTNQLGMNSVGQKFLRGFQISDESGVAKFTTIYPGWYPGRAVHIHFKMRTAAGYDFTSQLFFDDALSDTVFAQPPYDSRGERRLRNGDDGIFRQSGDQMLLIPEKSDAGYTALFDVALSL